MADTVPSFPCKRESRESDALDSRFRGSDGESSAPIQEGLGFLLGPILGSLCDSQPSLISLRNKNAAHD